MDWWKREGYGNGGGGDDDDDDHNNNGGNDHDGDKYNGYTYKQHRQAIYYHGILMAVGFFILMPVGILVARYYKNLAKWFEVHAFLMFSAVALISAAFGIIVNAVHKDFPHSDKYGNLRLQVHSAIGLAVYILLLIQYILGFVTHKMYVPGRAGPPVFPDKVHWFTGRLTLTGAIVNGFIGLSLLGLYTKLDHDTRSKFMAILAAWIFVIFLTFMVHEYRARRALVVVHTTNAPVPMK